MSKFSFRRSEKNEFKHIAYGLVPAATIAPRPAVPRTPPPRSPCPSPDRDRSALAAAILSSSLTGRTVAIPPTRSFSRSLSESDCSRSENNNIFQPLASTALYTKDRWRESLADRPRLPSPGCSDEEFDEDEEDAGGEGLSEDDHVYQSLDRQERSQSRTLDDIYAKPLKQGFQSERAEETDDSLGIVSPLPCEEIEVQKGALRKTSPKPQRMPSSNRTMPSSDVTEDTSAQSPKDNQGSSTKKSQKKSSASRRDGMRDGMRDGSSGPGEAYREVLDVQREMTRALTEQNQSLAAERRALEQRCAEQSLQLQTSHERLQQLERQLELSRASAHTGPSAGEQAELVSLRQQAQELVDENDSLKMTVHRLTVELSRYQARFRPLGKEELDMKYLSPLLLAYEDRLGEKDALLQSVQEDLGKLRQRVEEVVRENERLHDEMSKTGGISHKEWKQLQEQARLVLQENQVLIEQLEVQHTKARDSHNRHHAEVTRVSKQLMLLEVEKQRLEAELEEVRAELRVLQAQHVQARSCLENAVSWEEHCAIATKLKRQLEQEGGRKQSEVEELQERVSSLEAEKRRLVQDKAGLTADIKSMEAERERSRHASRKAQRKIGVLKQHMEASLEKELTAHQYLASIVALAEKTTQERDQLMHMASVLEQDKQGVLATALDGTVRLGKLHERVKVFRKQTAASLGVLGQRLREQEEDFAGKAASYQRQIQHLQTLLRDKQGDLDGALLQKREVEDELEVVWQAATRENQRIREAMLESSPSAGSSSPARGLQGLGVFPSSPGWLSDPQEQGKVELSPPPRPDSSGPPPFASRGSSGGRGTLQRSPMFGSDSDQHQNPSSDESEKNAMDFYS